MCLAVSVILGSFARQFYYLFTKTLPDRKEVRTFTQFKLINQYMLLWPLLFGFSVLYIKPKLITNDREKRSFRKYLKLNVVCQIFMTYLFYYIVYYTTEMLANTFGSEVISGHIYTGILASSSFISTLCFLHKYRDENSSLYKAAEIVTILFTFHMAYSFFWTSFIYHTFFDSSVGLIVGVWISF